MRENTAEHIEKLISMCLLKQLLEKKIINQSTYNKVVKKYKGKEVA